MCRYAAHARLSLIAGALDLCGTALAIYVPKRSFKRLLRRHYRFAESTSAYQRPSRQSVLAVDLMWAIPISRRYPNRFLYPGALFRERLSLACLPPKPRSKPIMAICAAGLLLGWRF